jgi:protein-tyrosine phosphatase
MICAMLLDLAGATADAIAGDYADGCAALEPTRATAGPATQTADLARAAPPPAHPGELRRQMAEREPVLREWVRAFDTGSYLTSNGLTDREIGTLESLLRP